MKNNNKNITKEKTPSTKNWKILQKEKLKLKTMNEMEKPRQLKKKVKKGNKKIKK